MTFKEVNELLQKSLFNPSIGDTMVRKIDDKYRFTITYLYRPFKVEAMKFDSRNLVMNIPNRFHQNYIDIEEVVDYDLTSNLVLEMLSRNKLFKKFLRPYLKYECLKNKIELTKIEKSIEKKYCKLKKAYSEYLSFNMDYYDNFCLKKRTLFSNHFSNHKYIVDSFPRLCDVNNGLKKAIEYYYKKESILPFPLNNHNEILLNKVLKDYHSYSFVLEDRIVNIDENLPISCLDKEFKETISERDLINRVEKIKIGSIFTDLEFIGLKIVNVDLNMNLPLEELIAYLTKIKNEYSKSKNILEIFNDKLQKINNPKSLAVVPKNIQKRKKTYADAFYIYDLFQCIDKYFYKMRKEIKNKYNKDKEEIKTDKSKSITIKNIERDKIKYDYKIQLNYYNKDVIYDVINEITGTEINKIRKLHKLLKEYIEDLKYKNIIFNK